MNKTSLNIIIFLVLVWTKGTSQIISYKAKWPKHEGNISFKNIITTCRQQNLMNVISQENLCKPTPVLLENIPPPHLNITIISPKFIKVDRCQGLCTNKVCTPKTVEQKDIQISFTACNDITSCAKSCAVVQVSNHLQCECSCKNADCKPNLHSMNQDCSCICNNEHESANCPSDWDNNLCKCTGSKETQANEPCSVINDKLFHYHVIILIINIIGIIISPLLIFMWLKCKYLQFTKSVNQI